MSVAKVYPDPRRLVPRLRQVRRRRRTVVFANGCFDLLHVGHVRYLEAAKALGDLLIVAVNTDASMRLVKPHRRPVVPDAERIELVAALEAVDYVVPLEDRTPIGLIELFRPDIHTKGTDYTLDRLPERPIVEAYGGRVALVGGPKDHSTTELLRAIEAREERGPMPAGGAAVIMGNGELA